MVVFHTVFIQFKADLDAATVQAYCEKAKSLPEQCLHPKTGAPYIKKVSGGKNHSPEGLNNGITHALIMEFETTEDRDYYALHDPGHITFKEKLTEVLDALQVVDFTPDEF